MSIESTVESMQGWGSWAWALGIGLLWIDLFLPILGTVVMSALGLIYGPALGALIALVGAMSAGLTAYGLARVLGRKAAVWLVGEKGLEEGERLFRGSAGGWLIALSRWMPILPEVMACMAGLSRMPFLRFVAALVAGSLPLCLVFAWIGSRGDESPIWTLILSAGLPPLIWLVLDRWIRRLSRENGAED
jgi:uncharacterized membrane protein YdjX (TVP38/TMEM64 family)